MATHTGYDPRHDNTNGLCCGHPLGEGAGETVCGCVPCLSAGEEPFVIFTEGDELYESMLASINSARHSIRLESYIFADDEVGRRFARAMAEKACSGMDVRLLIDAAGSLFWSSRALGRHIREHGVCLRYFHRWNWRAPLSYNRRDHRKILVIDENILYLGGFNIHRESSLTVFGRGRWRDTHVCVYGKLAEEAARLFDAFWEGRLDMFPEGTTQVSALVPNNTRICRHPLHCLYADSFRRATRSIYLTTPYFVPDHSTLLGLADAARRGVDCRLLVPRKNDVWLVQWAAQATYANILRAGVRIYEYLPRLLHAKTAVVDGVWATIGTSNMDYRSFFVNYELNLVTCNTELCHRLKEQFMHDISESEEISPSAWARRPWGRRVTEMVGWLARRWL